MFTADYLASTPGLITQNLVTVSAFSFVHPCKNCRHSTHTLDPCLSHTAERHLMEFSQFLNCCVLQNKVSTHHESPAMSLCRYTRYHCLLTLTSCWYALPCRCLSVTWQALSGRPVLGTLGIPKTAATVKLKSLRLLLETLTSPLPYIYFCFCKCANYV